jgi:hypothetical protein
VRTPAGEREAVREHPQPEVVVLVVGGREHHRRRPFGGAAASTCSAQASTSVRTMPVTACSCHTSVVPLRQLAPTSTRMAERIV